jgi:hypothetical protein
MIDHNEMMVDYINIIQNSKFENESVETSLPGKKDDKQDTLQITEVQI